MVHPIAERALGSSIPGGRPVLAQLGKVRLDDYLDERRSALLDEFAVRAHHNYPSWLVEQKETKLVIKKMCRGWCWASTLSLLAATAVFDGGPVSRTSFGQEPRAAQSDAGDNEADNRRALAYYANAADFQNSGKFELASDEWEKLVTQFPTHPQASTAWHHLGVCSLQRGTPDYAKAIQAFTQALRDDKLNVREESLINLSWALLTQARQAAPGSPQQKAGLEQARARMVEFLKAYGDGSYVDQALYYLGEVEHLLGDRKRSIAYYKKLLETKSLEKSSLRPDAMYALAVGYEEEQQSAEARRRYTAFLSAYPEHRLVGEVRLRLADLMLQNNQAAEAAEMLAKIPASAAEGLADYALLRLGFAQSQLGDSTAAAETYRRLLEQFPKSPHAEAALLSLGQVQFKAGEFDDAAKQFQRVVQQQGKQTPDAAHWLALTWLRQNQPALAIPMLEEVLKTVEQHPLATTLQMDYADALYALPARLDQATAAYEALANEHPDDPLAPRAAYNAAFAALQAGKVAEARRWAETFLARYPQDPLRNDVAYIAAEALLQQGEHATAAEAYSKLVKADPQNPSFNLWNLRLGMAWYLAGKYQAAIDLLGPLTDELPEQDQQAEARFILGACHLFEEKIPQAIEHLAASHRLSDSWPAADEVLMMLAEAQQRNSDNAAAQATLEKLLEKYPQSRLKAQVEYKLAQLAAAAGNLDEAIRRYQALVQDPESQSYHNFARYGSVWCLMQQDQYAEALEALQPLLSQRLRDSIGSEAKLAEGVCLRKLGRTADAVQALQDFLKTNPSGTSLANGLYELALAETEQEHVDQAIELLLRIQQEVPDYAAADKVLYELAWNYQDQGKTEQAREFFGQLAQKFPQSSFAPEALYMQAEQQYDQQLYDQAVATYTRVISQTSDAELLEKAKYKLGWSYYQQERYPQAAKEFTDQAKQYAAGPLAVDALFMNAECAFKQDRFEDALGGYEQARQALEAAPDRAAASPQIRTLIHLHAGQCLRELERWNEAEAWLRIVVDRYADSPFLPTALYELGYCKQNQNQLSEALAYYAEVAGDYRTEVAARARFMMGELYFSQRDFVKAIPEFQRVMFGFGGDKAPDEIKNWQARSAFEAARCSEVLIETLKGNARDKVVATAKEFYEFIVQKHASHELAAQAQTRLGELQKLR